jgi:hypothetical protein
MSVRRNKAMAEKVIFEWHANDETRMETKGFPFVSVFCSPGFLEGKHFATTHRHHGMEDMLDFYQSMYEDLYGSEELDE